MSAIQIHQSTPVHEWNPLTEILVTTTQIAENDTTQIAVDHASQMQFGVRSRVGKYGIREEVAIKMPWAERSQASIPSSGTLFHATEGHCAFYRRIFRSNNRTDTNALKKWQDLDAVIGSDEVKRTLFGDSGVKNHIYVPCVRKILPMPQMMNDEERRVRSKKRTYILKVQLMKEVPTVNQYPDPAPTVNQYPDPAPSESDSDDRKVSTESDSDDHRSNQEINHDGAGEESTTIPKFSKSNPQILTQFLVHSGTAGDEYGLEKVETMSDVRNMFRSHGYFQDTLHIAHVWKTRTIDWYGRYLYGVTLRVVKVYMRDSVPEMYVVDSVPRKSDAIVDEGVIVTDSDGSDDGVHASSAERPANDSDKIENAEPTTEAVVAAPREPVACHEESSIPDQTISQAQCLVS